MWSMLADQVIKPHQGSTEYVSNARLFAIGVHPREKVKTIIASYQYTKGNRV